MATTTPNYGWPVPTSTDLVKNGATAIEALGDAIDGAFVDLKGGTTGQVLSKTSNTDMDFTWVAQDDSNAIQNSIVNAKGDLIGASANDVPAILSVGSNGETLVADSSTSTGLRYQSNFAAGKNKCINGDFGIWQRGTSITNSTSFLYAYTADRFLLANNNGGTIVTSRQAFTPGTAPVAGYEGQYFFRTNATVAGTGNRFLIHQIENVQTFAGQTVTFSFWAKANANLTSAPSALYLDQNFGSGGSGGVGTNIPTSNFTVTTSWQRFTFTVAVPSIAGKTIGTSSYLGITWTLPDTFSTFTLDLWGWQLEAGSVATAFQTATGTLQGELAACQRYYQRITASNNYGFFGTAIGYNSTTAYATFYPKVNLRNVTSIDYSTLAILQAGSGITITSAAIQTTYVSDGLVGIALTAASGITADRPYQLSANNSGTAFLGISGEL